MGNQADPTSYDDVTQSGNSAQPFGVMGNQTDPTADRVDGLGRLALRRQTAKRGRRRAWRIRLDEEELARIKDGETVTLDLTPGGHSVYLRVDWMRSRKYNIVVRAGETLRLRCAPNMPDEPPLAVPIRDYITLSRDDEASALSG